MAWYFQSSPHDTHDWDATQTPVLIDGEIDGQPRKLLAQAAATASSSCSIARTARRSSRREYVEDELDEGLRREGPADSRSGEGAADRRRAGLARTRAARPTGRRRASARRPDSSTSTPRARSASTTSTNPDEKPQGWGGNDRGGWSEAMLQAIDYKTGKVRWTHRGTPTRTRACSPRPATCSSRAATARISSR